ncbi:MAG: hypothetical protein NTY38_02700 [Acidobacteria bacterium]|nr:hypothetical protein [Acidobacteriota bacterium]
MALTVGQLQTQRDAILDEMGKASHVEYGERRITRRPQDELDAALMRIDSEIAALQSLRARLFTIQTSRGI